MILEVDPETMQIHIQKYLVVHDCGKVINPLILDVPRIETAHGETLSPLNPMGVKGAGEAGAISIGPLFAQALEDALHDVDFEISEIPLNLNRLWEIVNKRD